MESNNNTSQLSESKSDRIIESKSVPAVLAVTDLGNGIDVNNAANLNRIHLSDDAPKEFTSVPLETRQSATEQASQIDGFTIKQKRIVKQVANIHKNYWKEFAFAILRNVLYWCAVVCILILLANVKDFSNWSNGTMAALIMVLGLGLLGAGFHAAHVCSELHRESGTSVLGQMLFSPITRDEFQQMMVSRQLSAPEIHFEVSLRSTAGISSSDTNHWARVSRKLRREMTYRGWADQSSSVQGIPWVPGRASWMVVAKDFRCVDPQSQLAMDAEVSEFRRESGYDAKRYFMSFDLSLQWKEHDCCFDAEPFLIVEDKLPILYDVRIYKCLLFLGLDAFYRLLFFFSVKKMEDYFVVKFIEK